MSTYPQHSTMKRGLFIHTQYEDGNLPWFGKVYQVDPKIPERNEDTETVRFKKNKFMKRLCDTMDVWLSACWKRNICIIMTVVVGVQHTSTE
jgi:hypothetical protein